MYVTIDLQVLAKSGDITSEYCVPPSVKLARIEQFGLGVVVVMLNHLTVLVVAPVWSKQRLITRACAHFFRRLAVPKHCSSL